jgi:predicted nuclease of predicted toxin-antitoxin system
VPLALYMDVHIPRAITNGLKRRGVEVITAQEDSTAKLDDPPLLDRATELNRPLYTQDDDLLAEARRRQTAGEVFSGVIYSHQLRSPIGRCVDDLELVAKTFEPEDLKNRVEFIPF